MGPNRGELGHATRWRWRWRWRWPGPRLVRSAACIYRHNADAFRWRPLNEPRLVGHYGIGRCLKGFRASGKKSVFENRAACWPDSRRGVVRLVVL